MTRLDASESAILSACLEYLESRGIFAWRNNAGAIPLPGGGFRAFRGMKGVSDILGILPQTVEVVGVGPVTFGNILAVEVKTKTGKLRPEQKEFLDTVNRLGGIGLCVRSVGELETALSRFL